MPEDHQVYRIKVVTAFLKSGVPISKVESVKDLLEENAFCLTDRCNLHDYVPFILKEEENCVCSEIDGQQISVIFDGTSSFGEALAIVRFIDGDWRVQQRIVGVQMLSTSLSGEEVVSELISVLSVSYGVRSSNLLVSMKDRASINNVAMHTLKVVYPLTVDVGCFSHTIDHVGGCFDIPTRNDFVDQSFLIQSENSITLEVEDGSQHVQL